MDGTVTPVETPCSRKYTAVHTSGTRPPGSVLWIVLHDEEADTAEAAARWFENPDSAGSAHLCIDGAECFRTLTNDQVAWGAQGANNHGFHIEQAAFAKWSSTTWLTHRPTLRRAAYKAALHCLVFNVPTVFRFAADLKARRPGVTTHAQCSKAFGGNHSDPGLFWPRRLFMRYVREYYAQLNV